MLIVDFRKRSIQETDPISREQGVKIGVTIKKNHAVHGRNMYLKTEYFGIYGQGTEIYIEVMQLAISQGILTKAGAFIRLPDENGEVSIINGEKMQWQGNAKFRQYCIDNPKFFENLKSMVKGEAISMDDEEINLAKAETEVGDDIKEAMEDVIEVATTSKAKKSK